MNSMTSRDHSGSTRVSALIRPGRSPRASSKPRSRAQMSPGLGSVTTLTGSRVGRNDRTISRVRSVQLLSTTVISLTGRSSPARDSEASPHRLFLLVQHRDHHTETYHSRPFDRVSDMAWTRDPASDQDRTDQMAWQTRDRPHHTRSLGLHPWTPPGRLKSAHCQTGQSIGSKPSEGKSIEIGSLVVVALAVVRSVRHRRLLRLLGQRRRGHQQGLDGRRVGRLDALDRRRGRRRRGHRAEHEQGPGDPAQGSRPAGHPAEEIDSVVDTSTSATKAGIIAFAKGSCWSPATPPTSTR